MNTNSPAHWDLMYGKYATEQRGWYRPRLERSLDWIRAVASPDQRILDAGGGASPLAADLVAAGYGQVTVVDLSRVALDEAQARMPDAPVTWVCGDLRDPDLVLPATDIWHDRAVFHFMTGESDQTAYLKTLERTLTPEGIVIAGAFHHEAPPKCSGLPVQRYDPDELAAAFGPGFACMETARDLHITPGGTEQPYSWVMLRRTA